MIKIKYGKIQVAAEVINYLFERGIIYDIITFMPDLGPKYANVTPREIASILRRFKKNYEVAVNEYRAPSWKYKYREIRGYKVLGHVEHYWAMNIDSRHAEERDLPSVIGSIAHELSHCLEKWCHFGYDREAKFGHGDNSPIGKAYTFPFAFGRAVKQYVEIHSEELIQNIKGFREFYDEGN